MADEQQEIDQQLVGSIMEYQRLQAEVRGYQQKLDRRDELRAHLAQEFDTNSDQVDRIVEAFTRAGAAQAAVAKRREEQE